MLLRDTLPARERVPDYYCLSEQTRAILETLADASLKAGAALEDVAAQFFVDTATWGLDLWEAELGLAPARDAGSELRRRQVAAQLMGRGTTTPETVRAALETALGVPVYVIEVISEGRIELILDSGGRIPAEPEQIGTLLGDIMPAHLGWDCEILLRTYVPVRSGIGPRVSVTTLQMR